MCCCGGRIGLGDTEMLEKRIEAYGGSTALL